MERSRSTALLKWDRRTLPDSLLGVGLALVCALPAIVFDAQGRASFDGSLLVGPALAAALFREVGTGWRDTFFFQAAHRLSNAVQWLLGGVLAFPLLLGADAQLLWFSVPTLLSAWYLRRGPPGPSVT